MKKKKEKTTHKQWEIAVRTARQFVNRYAKVRWKVCEIALSVCDVSHGGRKGETAFTLTRFAKEIDLNKKTLFEWIRVKRLVYDKLPTKIQSKIATYNYVDLTTVAGLVDTNTNEKQVHLILKGILEVPPENRKFLSYYQRDLGAILYNAQRPINMMNVDTDIIEKLIQRLELIASLFKTELELRTKYSTTERLTKINKKQRQAVKSALNENQEEK